MRLPSVPTRSAPWWWLPVFLAVAFLLFWPVLGLSGFSDDHSALWNAGVRGIPWREGFFRPLSDLSFRLGYRLWGTAVEGHRAFNVVVHGTNAFLLSVLMSCWAGRTAGLLSAFLFLVYPFHQESIVWLVGRESALGTMAVLLGLVIGGANVRRPLKLGLMAVTMLLGALTYESAVLLLPLALLVAWSGQVRGWPGVPPLLIALGGAIVGWFLWRGGTPVGADHDYTLGLLPKNGSELIMRTLKVAGRLFLPPATDSSVQLVRGALLAGLFLTLAFTFARATRRTVMSGKLRLLALLTVVASVIAVAGGVSTVTSESDRYLYLPSAFLCGLVGTALSGIGQRRLRVLATLALFTGSIVLLHQNHAHWQEASRLTRRCLNALPSVPEHGDLWLAGLPDAHAGAFIFRNGLPEAVDLAGGAGARIIVVPEAAQLPQALAKGMLFRGVWRTAGPQDRAFVWRNERFEEVPPQEYHHLVPLSP